LVEARGGSVIRPLDVRQTKQAMDTYQEGLRSILDDSDWQNAGSDGKFVKKSGWRKIATWFGLSVTIVSQRVERDPDTGDPLRASVIASATAPNGRVMEGDGHCSSDERRFQQRGGRAKLENDLINTATTRAKNRAIADLVGMGAVSAEEIEGTTVRQAQGPPFGEPASDELQDKLVKALNVLVGPERIVVVIEKLAEDAGGYLPRISARAVCLALADRLGTQNVPDDGEKDETQEGVTDGEDDGGSVDDGGADAGADDAGGADAGPGEGAD
jgi:hypothetical protein